VTRVESLGGNDHSHDVNMHWLQGPDPKARASSTAWREVVSLYQLRDRSCRQDFLTSRPGTVRSEILLGGAEVITHIKPISFPSSPRLATNMSPNGSPDSS
jgi:hypothetical protein